MSLSRQAAALAVTLALCAGGVAAAEKQAQPAPQATPSAGNTAGYGVKLGGFFTEQHKQVTKRYFAKYAKGKDCPPGMQRTGKTTCKPIVDGHFWAVGQRLQKAVETHPLPEPLLAQLPPPPQGYEYALAADDVLLLSKGLQLVVDFMPDVMG